MLTRLASTIGLTFAHLCLAAAMVYFLAPHAVAQTQETGAIQGRVLNVASGNYLENARINVRGTKIETFTNDIGEYRLSTVAAGETQLTVTYTGMESQTTVVRVAPRQTLQQDFSLALAGRQADGAIVQLEKFTVEERELTGLAVALHERRNAPNIKNVVSLDEFGDMGEGNVGDFLKYVPGVSVQYFPQTPGSASVRGMPASGTLVMVNGAEMATPGLVRGFDLGMSASGNIDRVEISKVPTPEMPANAVGGSINMIPKSGFSRSKPLLSYNVFLAHNDFLDRAYGFDTSLSKRAGPDPKSTVRYVQPAFNLSYIWPVRKTLAFTFALSKAPRYSDYVYFSDAWDRVRMIETQYRFGTLILGEDRELAAATVDWKINERHVVQAGFQASNQNNITRQHHLFYNAGANATGGPGFTQGAPTGVGNVNASYGWTGQYKTLRHFTLNYRYEGAVWRFDGNAALSKAGFRRHDTEDGFFANIFTTIPNLMLRWEGMEGMDTTKLAKLTATDRAGAPVNVFDGRNYPVTGATINPYRLDDQIARAGINARRSFNFSVPVTLKLGGLINRQTKDTTTMSTTLNFVPPGGEAARLVGNYDLISEEYSNRQNFTDAAGAAINVRWPSMYKMYNLYKQHPDWFEYSPANQAASHTSAVNASKKLEETISAAYVRGDVKLLNNRLWLVGGVRYEKTMDQGWGPRNDIRGVYQQEANGNLRRDAAGRLIPVTTDVLQRAKLQYTERGTFAERSYDGLFPSVNSSFEITENLILRAAYARTIGRPELAEIIPGVSVTDPDAPTQNRTISVINSGLKPWTSNNYDLTLESYGFKGAVTTLSLFRKDIVNFFGSTRTPATTTLLAEFGFPDDYLNYDIITKRNVGAASIDGFEIGYRQSLPFLPAWGRGLQIYFNVTSLRLSGPNAEDFTNFSPRDINWGLSYAYRTFIGKLNIAQFKYIRQSPVAANATTPPNTYTYVGPQTRIDLSLEYRFSRKLSLYGSARNLNVSIKRSGRWNPDTPHYAKWDVYQKSGAMLTLGLKGEF